MNTRQTIETRLRGYVLKTFPLVAKRGIKDDEKWLESGLLDSFGVLDLVQFLEQEFGIHVSDEELLPERFESLQAVASFVESKLGALTHPPSENE